MCHLPVSLRSTSISLSFPSGLIVSICVVCSCWIAVRIGSKLKLPYHVLIHYASMHNTYSGKTLFYFYIFFFHSILRLSSFSTNICHSIWNILLQTTVTNLLINLWEDTKRCIWLWHYMVHGAYIALATTDECDTIFVRCNARAATAADAPRRTHLPIRNHMIFCALRSTCRIKLHACHGGRRCRRCTQYRVESVCVRHYSELYTHDFFFFIPFFGLMARCSNTANSKFDRRKVKMHVFISSSSSLIMRLRRLLLVVKP